MKPDACAHMEHPVPSSFLLGRIFAILDLMILIAIRHDVKTLVKLVVVRDLEFAVKRTLFGHKGSFGNL